MLQDIYPHKLLNQYQKDAVVSDENYVLSFDKQQVLMMKSVVSENQIDYCIPTYAELKNYMELDPAELTFLFDVDDTSYFLLKKQEISETSEGLTEERFEYVDLRMIRGCAQIEQHQRYAIMTGKHLNDWYNDMKFCGRCGHPMEHSKTERAKVCPSCKYTAYPRIMPAVIVGVKNGERLLLTKYRVGFAHNALIAGFVEIGETLEETVAREVMEEAGVRVKNIQYYKSQPWGIANDILTGFYCEVDGDDTITMDTGELKYAEWVKREDIVLQPDNSSLTNEMMMMFKDGVVR